MSFKNPGIVKIFGTVQTPTELWAVLEFCELGSLDHLLLVVTGSEDDPTNVKNAARLLAVFPLADSGNAVLSLRALLERKLGSSLTGCGRAFLRFAEQLSGAVAYIHKMGTVHSDIKVTTSSTTTTIYLDVPVRFLCLYMNLQGVGWHVCGGGDVWVVSIEL